MIYMIHRMGKSDGKPDFAPQMAQIFADFWDGEMGSEGAGWR